MLCVEIDVAFITFKKYIPQKKVFQNLKDLFY